MKRPGAMQSEVLSNVIRGRKETIRYPFEPGIRPERLRGRIEHDIEKCTGCGLCSRDCPATAITMVESTKTKTKKKPQFRFDRCIWCGTCEAVCPKKAITMSTTFEMAAFNLKDQSLVVVSEDPEPAEKVQE